MSFSVLSWLFLCIGVIILTRRQQTNGSVYQAFEQHTQCCTSAVIQGKGSIIINAHPCSQQLFVGGIVTIIVTIINTVLNTTAFQIS